MLSLAYKNMHNTRAALLLYQVNIESEMNLHCFLKSSANLKVDIIYNSYLIVDKYLNICEKQLDKHWSSKGKLRLNFFILKVFM